MSNVEHLEDEVKYAIKRGNYRTTMITTKYLLKRELTTSEIDDLTRNCLRWTGDALSAARQGASRGVIEDLIADFISDGDGVSAGNAAELNGRTLVEDEVDSALSIVIKKRGALSVILRIASLGISRKYLNELIAAYEVLQENQKYDAMLRLKCSLKK